MRQHTCPRPYRRTRRKQVCDDSVVANPVQGGNVARNGTKLPVSSVAYWTAWLPALICTH